MRTEEPADEPHRVTRPIAVVIGVLAALLYASFLLDWALRGFTGMDKIVSELEAPGEPNAVLLRVTDVVSASLVLTLLPWVRAGLAPGRWRELAVWAMVVFAGGAILAAVVAAPCGPGEACGSPSETLRDYTHDASSIASDTALYVSVAATWFATRSTGPSWLRRIAWWDFWLGGVLASLIFGYSHLTSQPAWAVGPSQRVHILAISVWFATLGVFAGTRPRAGPGPAQNG